MPRYLILPELKNTAQAIVGILQCLEGVWPALFPDRIRRDWINGDDLLLPEEKKIKQEIHDLLSNANEAVRAKNKELELVANDNSFVRDLLVATEDATIEKNKRLSAVVKKALDFLAGC